MELHASKIRGARSGGRARGFAATLVATCGIAAGGPLDQTVSVPDPIEPGQPISEVQGSFDVEIDTGSSDAKQRSSREIRVQPDDRGQRNDRSVSRMIVVDDAGHRLEIVLRDGDLDRATVDGEPVGEDRIQIDDDRVNVLSEDGDVMFRVQRAGRGTRILSADGDLLGRMTVEPTRRVVLGITMSEPDQVVLEHLGLEPGAAVKIDRVYEGLPADKAGLEPNDIIVRIDRETHVSTENLSELLAEHDPGETVEIEAIRKGERRVFKVELAPYREGVFGEGFGSERRTEARVRRGAGDGRLDALIAEMVARMRQAGAEVDSEVIARIVRDALERRAQDGSGQWSWQGDRRWPGARLRFSPDGEAYGFLITPTPLEAPSPPMPPRSDDEREHRFWSSPEGMTRGFMFSPREGRADPDRFEKHLDRLSERLEALEHQLDRIERHLERLAEER